MKSPIGFIGLGLMGRPMAANLLKAGYDVTVWNRTPSRADGLVEQGAKRAATPRDVATASEVVFTIVSDPPALESVLWGGDGVFAGMRRGSVLVDSSTVSPGDRKSTRLNSSHANISYAVFCLKKKKTNATHNLQLPNNSTSFTKP